MPPRAYSGVSLDREPLEFTVPNIAAFASEGANISAPLPRRRGARIYLVGAGVAQVCALVRYTVLARLLGPEQLGLAATVILTSQFFDSITDSGSDRYLIQDRDGDTPQVQSLVQLVYVSRGLFIATALLIGAAPLAAFYRAPALAEAFVLLAVSPLIFGFLHLDIRRAQRHNDFRAEAVGMLIGESLGFVVAVTAAFATRNFIAVVYGLIARSVAMVVVSHSLAARKYRLRFSSEYAPRLARFALPLMLNGLLLFFGLQGDRLIVVSRLGLTTLGQYSAVLLLIYYPSSLLTRYLATMHLPLVAKDLTRDVADAPAVERLAGQAMLLGLLMAAGFLAVGPMAVVLLYGKRFSIPVLTLCLIGLLQIVRFIRIWPNTVAVGVGRSGIVLSNNIARLIGIPVALAAVVLGGDLEGLVAGLISGEVIALATGILLINRALARGWTRDLDRLLVLLVGGGGLVACALAVREPNLLTIAFATAAIGVTIWRAASREWRTVLEAATFARRFLRWAPVSP